MNLSYSISKPCTEDWGKMTTEEQGRHCQMCCKTVVDFSQKSNTEIIGFLKSNSETKVCGRFRAEQLSPNPKSLVPRLSPHRYRVFFAALFFVFGGLLFSSCNQQGPEQVMGDVAYKPDSVVDTAKHQNFKIDSAKKTGELPKKKCKKVETPEHPQYLLGDVAYDPQIDSIK